LIGSAGGPVRWHRLDDGVSSVEYALIAVFIAVVAAIGLTALGLMVEGLFQSGDDAFSTVPEGP
jgi:Flp pilus assembly pilin Flp